MPLLLLLEKAWEVNMYKLENQYEFFDTKQTFSVSWRKEQLKLLAEAINRYEEDIYAALKKDLNKSKVESFTTEVGIIKRSLKYFIKNLNSWMKLRKTKTPLVLFGRTSYTYYEPYGTVLIIGPFNFPFLSIMEPLIGAIACGNTVVVKPSEQTPNVSDVIYKIIESTFVDEYIHVELGGIAETQSLLNQKFDLIFFTGSQRVGRIILEKAAKNLTPVILELGGKSPVIVLEDADIKMAAERIVWGKLLNAGQVCIAPDYCLVSAKVKDELIKELKEAIIRLYSDNAEKSADFGRIISDRQVDKLIAIIEEHRDEIVYGGLYNERYIAPTLIDLKSHHGKVMEEEIFGPILPILSFETTEEIYEIVKAHYKPLAVYIFGREKALTKKLALTILSGSTMINDVIVFSGNEYLPFGGTGPSGMGNFHGEYSIKAFSHEKAVSKAWFHGFDKFMTPPYTESKFKLLKKMMR